MKANPVACNTHPLNKHPKSKKKSTRRPHENNDDTTAISVASSGSDRSKSKTAAPPLTFPTTYRPFSAPPHASDSVVKLADLLAQPMTAAKMSTDMTMMAAEANAPSISSTTKLFDDGANDRKVPIDSSKKLVDKVPLRTPSVSSHSKLLIDEVGERKMAAKDSKIHVHGSIKLASDDPIFDNDDINDPIKGIISSLTRNSKAINSLKTTSLTM